MKHFNNANGIVMPLVLIVMVVLALLGTALWQYSTFEVKQVVQEENKTRAYYIARTGAESLTLYLKRNPDEIEELLTKDPEGEKVDGIVNSDYLNENSSLDVSLSRSVADENSYVVTGNGVSNGVEQSVDILLTHESLYENSPVILTSPTLANFHENMTIEGDIIASGPVNLPDNYNYKLTNGEDYPFQEDHFDPVVVPELDYDIDDNSQSVNNGTYSIAAGDNVRIGSLTLRNSDLIIDTDSNSDSILVVDNLSIKGNIIVTGSGRAKIYVLDESEIITPNDTEVDESATLEFYLTEESEMEIQTGHNFNGLIYGPYDANLTLQAGPQFHGMIIVGELSGQGSKIGQDAVITLDDKYLDALEDPGVEVVIKYWQP